MASKNPALATGSSGVCVQSGSPGIGELERDSTHFRLVQEAFVEQGVDVYEAWSVVL